jgi:hypothetical protein
MCVDSLDASAEDRFECSWKFSFLNMDWVIGRG